MARDVPVNAMDLFPTLSELIGAPMPADRKYDGVSLTPLFSGKAIARSAEEPFYYYNCENLQCVRVGDWKLHLTRSKEQLPFWSVKKQEPITRPRLYNLAADAAEKTDLAAAHAERVAEMESLAKATRLKLGENMARGSEQRPTGTLFPEVPILSNHVTDWIKLSAEEKGRAKTEFKAAPSVNKEARR